MAQVLGNLVTTGGPGDSRIVPVIAGYSWEPGGESRTSSNTCSNNDPSLILSILVAPSDTSFKTSQRSPRGIRCFQTTTTKASPPERACQEDPEDDPEEEPQEKQLEAMEQDEEEDSQEMAFGWANQEEEEEEEEEEEDINLLDHDDFVDYWELAPPPSPASDDDD
ncbi:hypothetical protein PIB30_032997 [Stylosanthes scabra]|uniref:Uncharacterized protein n=1 Tax=Stylosanthes scabra TaxID=79078 RepID=A0ABU6TC51_9FABA|nr:hypothetical protein [Stylosanthes scabra]